MTETEVPTYDALFKLLQDIYPWQDRGERAGWAKENSTRMHRAISWLRCYENCAKCPETKADERFLFLWISFNAAYAKHDDAPSTETEVEKIQKFLCAVAERDENYGLEKIMGPLQDDFDEIIGKEFLSRDYWRTRTRKGWERLRSQKHGFNDSTLSAQNTLRAPTPTKEKIKLVLNSTFGRLYVLRNQILHGGATYGGNYNRSSVGPGSTILSACVPTILKIMLEVMREQRGRESGEWGKVEYPPHLDAPDPINPDPPPRRKY